MREAKGFVVGAVFAAVVAGFSVAMPRAIVSVAHQAEQEVAGDRSSPRAARQHGEERGAGTDAKGGDHGSHGRAKERPDRDNHGAAVSEAAKCPVKGRAHGDLVRSIAQDKTATPESARQACAQALAAGAASPGSDRSRHGKGPKAAKPPKPAKASNPGSRANAGGGNARSGAPKGASDDEQGIDPQAPAEETHQGEVDSSGSGASPGASSGGKPAKGAAKP